MLKENRFQSIIKLSREAYGKYKLQILILVILGFVTGILEGIGVNALIPLFSFAIGDGQGGTDFISRAIQRGFEFVHIDFTVAFLLLFISILFVAKALLTILLLYVKVKITSDYELTARTNIFNKILNSSWTHLLKQKLGHLETVLMIDVPVSTSLLDQISQAIMLFTSLSVYIVIALNISSSITLVTLVVGALLFLFFKPFIYKVKTLSYQRTLLNKETAHHTSENILGIKTVKSMMSGKQVADKGIQLFEKFRQIHIKLALTKNIVSSLIIPVSVIFICALFAFYYKSPSFSLPALVAIIYLIQKIFTYLQQLQKNLQNFNEAVPHLRSVLNYEKESAYNLEADHGKKDFTFNKALKFNNIVFEYNQNKQILRNVDFSISKGEMIGLIGPSGAGKTTLVDLILRLLDPTKGEILLDGQDIKKIDLKKWRKNIGYISQDIFLINDTIKNNIKFYNDKVSNEDVIEAAKMANIYDFVQSMPDKFDTNIGERGFFISAGQRQRIVIARVLARKPQFLILDEATSALDNESEIKIQEVIKKLKGKITVLAIAHRLSTIIDSDRLLALDNGAIVEEGEPAELLKNEDSYFHKVYNIRK
ncbi:MAG: ABC transporter ATP-binding protein [Candidatus Kuenenbacteria bacterium]